MTETKSDLGLSEIWDAMVAAGVQVYEWCDGGIATGCRVIKLGGGHVLICSDAEGYAIDDAPTEDVLVPIDEYDEEAAIRAASDLEGWFGIVGVPGSVFHSYEWFETREEAGEWVKKTWEEIREANPVVGFLGSEIVMASDAFDRRFLDGTRVYFQEKVGGYGFEP